MSVLDRIREISRESQTTLEIENKEIEEEFTPLQNIRQISKSIFESPAPGPVTQEIENQVPVLDKSLTTPLERIRQSLRDKESFGVTRSFEPEDFEISKFLRNIPKESAEILKGVGSLILSPFTLVTEKGRERALETAKNSPKILRDILEDVFGTFGFKTIDRTIPFIKQEVTFDSNVLKKKWEERPVSALLDVATILPPFLVIKAIRSGTKFATRGTRVGELIEEIGKKRALKKSVRDIRADAEAEFFTRRNNEFKEVRRNIAPLDNKAKKMFADLAQGTGKPDVSILSTKQQGRLNDALEWWRRKSTEEANELIKAGRLTAENVETSKWIPMVAEKFKKPVEILEVEALLPASLPLKSSKAVLTRNQFKQVVDDFRRQGIAEPIYFPDGIPKRATLTDIILGNQRNLRTGDFFLETEKTFKPGFLKKKRGLASLLRSSERDPLRALVQHRSQYLKYRESQAFLDHVKAQPWVKEFNKTEEIERALRLFDEGKISQGQAASIVAGRGLLPGHVLFAPDGFLRHYRANVAQNVIDRIDRIQDVNDILTDAIQSVLPRDILAASRTKVFQIPREVADQIMKQVRPIPIGVKLFYDKPIDYWRALVLPFRPKWQVNNILGNMTFSALAGVGPVSFGRLASRRWRNLIPEEAKQGLTRVELQTAQLGRASETLAGRIIEAVENTPPAKFIAGTKNFLVNMNAQADNFFRSAAFIKKANAKARWELTKKNGLKWHTTNEKIKYLNETAELRPEFISEITRDVEEMFGNFRKLGAFERRAIRRVFPFYAFMKHQLQLAAKLPTKFPKRTNLLNKLEDVLEMITPEENRQKLKEGKVFFEFTNPFTGQRVERFFDSGFANPLNIPMIELTPSPHINPGMLSALNPILKFPFEFFAQRSLFTGKPFRNPVVFEFRAPGFKTKHFRIESGSGELTEVTGTINLAEYARDQIIPQTAFIFRELEKRQRRPTIYSVLTHKDFPEKMFNWAVMNTEKLNRELDAIEKVNSISDLFGAFQNHLSIHGEFRNRVTMKSFQDLSRIAQEMNLTQ